MAVDQSAAFTVGVVEGFYGRPWTMDQREKLYSRLGQWGMTSYMYAPKDDLKHRAEWRDLYTEAEAASIGRMIKTCKRNTIEFIYALSPGLNIVFSDPEELRRLKSKLDQVVSLGCTAFALLFDDIDSGLSDGDLSTFGTFADCQVYIAHALYDHLNRPKTFLFCPTEYCASRAVPSVTESPYLRTLGEKLRPDIAVLWTGPRVISREIDIQSVIQIGSVLQRPPLIWDNLHANDYDQRRLFLGPYQNRPTALHRYIRGVLTNPNCEYEANFVAIRTLAMWSQAPAPAASSRTPYDYSVKSVASSTGNQPGTDGDSSKMAADGSGETCQGAGGGGSQPSPSRESAMDTSAATPATRAERRGIEGAGGCEEMPNDADAYSADPQTEQQEFDFGGDSYVPKAALVAALAEWLADFHRPCAVNLTAVSVRPIDRHDSGHESSSGSDTVKSAGLADSASSGSGGTLQHRPADGVPGAAGSNSSGSAGGSVASPRRTSTPFSLTHLQLLADLFYLPEEHGDQGLALIDQFRWLRNHYKWFAGFHIDIGDGDAKSSSSQDSSSPANAQEKEAPGDPGESAKPRAEEDVPMSVPLALDARRKTVQGRDSSCSDEFSLESTLPPEEQLVLQQSQYRDWLWHAKEFHIKCNAVQAMFNSLTEVPNRPLLYELYSYVWDVKEMILTLDAYLGWLEKSTNARKAVAKLYSGDQEPWVFRGGLAGELAHLVPEPEIKPISRKGAGSPPSHYEYPIYAIRPFVPADDAATYEVCLVTSDSGYDGTHLFPHHPNIVGHRYVGPYTNLSADFAYVVDDGDGVCGYVLGALDSRFFYQRYQAEWVPAIVKKYAPMMDNVSKLSRSEYDIWKDLSQDVPFLPNELYEKYPSHLHIDLMPRAQGKGIGKRMMTTLLKALHAKGSRGVHLEMSATNHRALVFYTKLGFKVADLCCDPPEGSLIMCRYL